MHITLFVQQFPVLSETFIVRKVVALAGAGHRVTVVSVQRPQKPAHQEVLFPYRHRIEVRYLHWRKDTSVPRPVTWMRELIASAFRSPQDLGKFWRQTRRHRSMRERWYYLRRLYGLAGLERADVYHFEFGGLAAYFLDVLDLYRPCVVSLRGSDISIYPLGNPEYAQNLKQALSLADKIHCVSQAVQREAASLLGSLEKMFVNYPSVDTAFFSPLDVPRQGNLVVTVSRFHWKKSLPTALMAVALLRRDCPDVRYVLVGDGTLEERTELAFHVHDLGIAEHVEFHGPASAEEVRELLAQASVFVLPSVSEGLPNSVLEAMAMEVPVVVTDAGGMPEAVADGVEGFVVPRRDYRALAEKIETLLRNPGLAREMGKKGRERVLRQFTLERQIETFLRVYQELAQHGR